MFINLHKAFDVVPHDKLIAKLEAFGACCKTLRWISAFLKEKKKVVRLNGIISRSNAVVGSVVQGGIFKPLLFTFCINDLPAHGPECFIKHYADDSIAKLLLVRVIAEFTPALSR